MLLLWWWWWWLFAATILVVQSLSASPWAPAAWRLTLDIGREVGTTMPDDWALAGGRLQVAVDCWIFSDKEPDQTDDFTGSRSARRLRVMQNPTYINSQGEQHIPVVGGAWNLQLPREKGQAGVMRLWLDLGQASGSNSLAAKRNDVTLAAHERLYLTANCWREMDYKAGRLRIKPIAQAAQAAQDRLDAQLSHETGDRRLDGTNPLDTLQASIDMSRLVRERDELVRAQREAEQIWPPAGASESRLGAWPGSNEALAIGPGTVAVKRKQLFGQEFCIVGTWKASPVPETAVLPSE